MVRIRGVAALEDAFDAAIGDWSYRNRHIAPKMEQQDPGLWTKIKATFAAVAVLVTFSTESLQSEATGKRHCR